MVGADYALVFGAGVISFASPCVLPLVPVYLSVTTGLGVAELSQQSRRTVGTVIRGAGLFILGFSAVFVALGLSATAVGGALARHQVPIIRLGGLVIVAMSVLMLASTTTRGPRLMREWRFHPNPVRRSMWTAPVTGAAFAFGWTPCIGPVLGSVLAIAASQGGVLRGGALLATYSAGLAVPLLLTGLAFHHALEPLKWTRRHVVGLTRGTAVLLAGYGILLVFDQLAWLTQTLQTSFTAAG